MSIFCPFDCTSVAEIPSCPYVMIPYHFLVDLGAWSSVMLYCVLQKSLRSFKETSEQVIRRMSVDGRPEPANRSGLPSKASLSELQREEKQICGITVELSSLVSWRAHSPNPGSRRVCFVIQVNEAREAAARAP